MFEKIEEYLASVVAAKGFPGGAAGVYYKGQRFLKTIGHLTYDTMSSPVTTGTVYDVASLTKVIPVSCCALHYLDAGVLSLDSRLIDWVPEFIGMYREEITVLHLLTHTLDFGYSLSSLKDRSGDVIMEAVLSAPLRSLPGMVFSYANATSILLGLLLERVAGMDLEKLAADKICIPLQMDRTTFRPDSDGCAPTEFDLWRGRIICGEVHDESAFSLRPKIVGSAGLFSTLQDVMNVVEMLVSKGVFRGKQLFKEETIKTMYTNALPPLINAIAGLGWEADQPFMGKKRSRATFGKTGFTGCSMVVDKKRDVGMVLLSNHTYPTRLKDRTVITEIRSTFADLVYEAVDTIQ